MRARLIAIVLIVCGLTVAFVSCPGPIGPTGSPDVANPAVASPSARPPVEPARERRRVAPATSLEPADLPQPPPPVVVLDGVIPEEDRGTGSEAVTIAIVDDVSGRVAAMQARLWRLGVPADERWPAGDHVQQRVWINGNGTRVDNLPPGRYRLEALGAAVGTGDPPEFTVPAPGDRVELHVQMPQPQASRLVVLDETGTRLTSAERTDHGRGASWTWPTDAPDWAAPRARRDPEALAGAGGGRRSLLSGSSHTVEAASDGAFPLPDVRAPGRHVRWDRWIDLRFAGRADVSARPSSADSHHGRYLAIAPRRELVLAHVLFPAGVDVASAPISISCEALPYPTEAPDGFWRTVPVTVMIALDGYEPLEFEWCVADAPYALASFVPSTDE